MLFLPNRELLLPSYDLHHLEGSASQSIFVTSLILRAYAPSLTPFLCCCSPPAGARFRHSTNAGNRISPCPDSSCLNTSTTGDLSLLRIRQTPSSLIVVFSPSGFPLAKSTSLNRIQMENVHSRKLAVKLIQTFPSQDALFCFTSAGILLVSNSSMDWRIPCLLRKPTMIFGTPSRKDWIQNFSSFRSYLSMSLPLLMLAAVLSSTQLIGSFLLSGLQSQTL